MKKAQWIIYDQCHIDSIEPGVTDIFFILFTGNTISSPMGNLRFNIRSLIAEYAIARSYLDICENLGYTIHWIEAKSYKDGIYEFVKRTGITNIVLMRPSEEYLAKKIEHYQCEGVSLSIVPNRQFLIDRDEFRVQFEKPPIMETFYRYMRKSRHILIDQYGKPVGGKWNYDHENRNFDKNHLPNWDWQPHDIKYIEEAKKYYTIGELDFFLPVSREDALRLLEYFIEYHLPDFGRLEDAMYQDDMRVHHSLLSTALNFGILSPLEVIHAALAADVPLSSKEGFVRQILGWREYMRQFYLSYYDDIYSQNILHHHISLPESWWNYGGKQRDGLIGISQKQEVRGSEDFSKGVYSGVNEQEKSDTDKEIRCFSEITTLNCVDTVIKRVQSENYSHHIERLMIIGNYTLLMGYDPLSVNRWFMEMYTDAFEWVVTPNVMGMSQYSDGGRLATKPYISGGNYIEKMSDYCKGCRYSIKEKTCPMTHLYWDFIDRNQSLFSKGRTPYILSTLAKIDRDKIREAKKKFIHKIS